jgi:hypothetical protein
MKNFNAIILAFAMMFSGSAFAADPASSAGGASVGDVTKAEPALCPCGKAPDGSIKWCPCNSAGAEASSGGISTTAVVAGLVAAGAIALAAGHSSSTTQH